MQCICVIPVGRFVAAEEMVAPWDGARFDVDAKIDDLDSDDDDDDDD